MNNNDETFEWTDSDGDRLLVELADTVAGDWFVQAFRRGHSAVVRVPSVEIDRLVRCLRPDWAPPLRYTVVHQARAWNIADSENPTYFVAVYSDDVHPDAEGAARAEADRLNSLEVQP